MRPGVLESLRVVRVSMAACVLPAVLSAGGCVAAPPAERSFPTLGEMAPAEPIQAPVVPRERPASASATATLTRITLPLEVSIEPAWAVVDENTLAPLARGVWRANGLRAGVLPGDRLPGFLAALGPVWSDSAFRVVAPDGPVLVRRSAPLIRPVLADLTVPPFAPRREELLGFRAALLLEMAPSAGGLSLAFTPLHQKPVATLAPQTSAEKERAGRLFSELALRLRVPAGSFAVVGLARDPGGLPTPAELAAPPPPPPAPGAAPPPPTAARLAPPPLPAHLGRALFTAPAEPLGDPQVLLLIQP